MFQENQTQRLLELIEEKKFFEVRAILQESNEVDIADLFDELKDEHLLLVYRLLPKETAAAAFAYLEPETQERLISVFSDKELSFVLDELYMDDVADLIEELPASVVKRVLRAVSSEERSLINQLMRYPEESAGSVLTTEFVDLKANMTIAQAFEYIRSYGPDKETIYTCYVTDDQRHLQGVLSVKELLLANSDQLVGSLMETNVIFAYTTDDQEEVANLCARYDLIALPVVDSEKRLVGIITVDDVVDIMRQETTEDMEKMAAILPTDKSYFRTGIFETFKNRIPWLLLLMISATFTGMIISGFENALAAQAALTAFIPMLMDTAGNSGSQSSVTVIRSLSLGDITFSDWYRVIWKELRVSLLCGLVLSVANFAKILLVDNLLMQSGLSMAVILVICLTLFFTILMAKVLGCSLPILAKKLGFDPAVMASPFITTIVDALSLLAYFGFATWILQI